MPTDVVMPQMGESIFEGTITKWLKKVGDAVEKDEPLFEISTDKVDAEIPSTGGRHSQPRSNFPKGQRWKSIRLLRFWLKEIRRLKPHRLLERRLAKSAAPKPAAAIRSAEPEIYGLPQRHPRQRCEPRHAGIEIVMPQMGESIFEGTITKWLKKVGDAVEKDEPLFEISTDKVDAEIPSSVAGVLTEIRATEGETVQINTVVAVIGGRAPQVNRRRRSARWNPRRYKARSQPQARRRRS